MPKHATSQNKVIFHIDVNSAFLSWEAVYRLQQGETEDLREMVSAIGGDVATRHGVILAKSVSAKKFHVTTGESIMEARRKCPQLVLVKPHHSVYKEFSKAFMSILREYSPNVEQYSIDEAFVDMTGMELLFGDPLTAAHTIKDRIYKELGFTVNVGISNNKLLAKMASDFEKPNKVHTLYPNEIPQKMWPLPVGDLFFCGGAAEKKLQSLGIKTIGQLAKSDKSLIESQLKKQGETLWNFANGIDESQVLSHEGENKGYGNSMTIAENVLEAGEAKKILLGLSEKVGKRLRDDGARAQVVCVQIRYHDFKNVSRQTMLPESTSVTNQIYHTACQLFDQVWNGLPIRLLGVSTSHVEKTADYHQMDLFETVDYEKMKRLDAAMDSIKSKFGQDAVTRATFITEKEPHSK